MEKTNSIDYTINKKKLSIQVSLNGLSFCISSMETGTIESYNEVAFAFMEHTKSLEANLKDYFATHPNLHQKFDEITVLHYNKMSALVPNELFDEDYIGSYLQYHTKVFDSDYFNHDSIEFLQAQCVYVPYIHLNNFLIEQLGDFEYHHSHSVLLKSISKLHDANTSKVYIYFNENQADFLVFKQEQFILLNSFEISTPTDLLYYTLFVMEQNQLLPDFHEVVLLGSFIEQDVYYQLLAEYIRNLSFLSIESLAAKNYFSASVNRKHFILFQA